MGESSLERRLYLPYSATQLFDLVADIERYPDFVPGWRNARVTHREQNRLEVEQSVKIGPAEWRFITEASLDRPRTIQISAVDAPFGKLHIHWTFEQLDDTGSAVTFDARFEPGPVIIRRVAAELVERQLIKLIQAFEVRARALYSGYSGV